MEQRHNDFAVRSFLLNAIKRPATSLPTYGELAGLFGGANQGQRAVLDRLARQCAARSEPDLTVVVVNADGRPGWFLGQPWSEEQRPGWESKLKNVADYPWQNEGL